MRARFQWHGYRVLALAIPFLGGCSSTLDHISSQRFREAPIHTLFVSDDPVEVLRKGADANDCAAAMRELKEPERNGKTDAEQDEMLSILGKAATSDKQPYCRMQAIEALGNWEDPRKVQILVSAYQNAPLESPLEKPPVDTGVVQAGRRTRLFAHAPSYTAENIKDIRCGAVKALGKKRSPEGLTLLCEIASTPVRSEPRTVEPDALGPTNAAQDQYDLRLAALRALGNYKGEMTAAQVLFRVMTTEHDPGLKNNAHESLTNVTGQSYDPLAPEWKQFLRLSTEAPAGVQPR